MGGDLTSAFPCKLRRARRPGVGEDGLAIGTGYQMPGDDPRGERAGMIVFDMADTTQISQIAEPLFMNVDAAVEFLPVMNADDLKEALGKVAAKR